EKIKEYQSDPLRHDKVSPGLFVGMLSAIDEVLSHAHEIHQPVLFQLSGDERICNVEAATTVFEKIGSKDKKIIIYPESLHEIYVDTDREQVIHDLKFYLKERESQ